MGKAAVICRDLAPPSKPRWKGFSGVLLKLINLTAVICILSLIADIARPKTDGPITLLNATVTNVESTSGPLLNESGINAEPEPHRSENATNKQPDNSDGNAEPPRFLAKARAGGEWQSIRMRVTAYCPCEQCCGRNSKGITSCGYKIQPGDTFVAADKRYPFDTDMLIPGYSNSQPVKVLDRGGAIKGNRLDVFFANHEEAMEWGIKYLDIKIKQK